MAPTVAAVISNCQHEPARVKCTPVFARCLASYVCRGGSKRRDREGHDPQTEVWPLWPPNEILTSVNGHLG